MTASLICLVARVAEDEVDLQAGPRAKRLCLLKRAVQNRNRTAIVREPTHTAQDES
jgi:hypothetical protein